MKPVLIFVNSTITGFSFVKPWLEPYKQAKGIANSKKELGNHYLTLSLVQGQMDLSLQYFLEISPFI